MNGIKDAKYDQKIKPSFKKLTMMGLYITLLYLLQKLDLSFFESENC